MNLLKRLWKEEEGQDLVEYALLVVLLALAATSWHERLSDCDQRHIHRSRHESDDQYVVRFGLAGRPRP